MEYSAGAAWMDGAVIPLSEAKISVFDWGSTRSDITYDVVYVWDGAFFRLEDYLDRFMASQAKLRLDVGMDRAAIRAALVDSVATSGLRLAYVSMVASRGVPIVPGTRDPRACKNYFYAWAVPFIWVIPPDVAKRGAHSDQFGRSDCEKLSLGDMTAALFQALDGGYDTTVLLDHEGFVTEGPGFNIFAVIDGTVVTPRTGMLEGISRKTVMEICDTLGLPCEARDIPRDAFLNADEVFSATTTGGPVAVTRVNGRILGMMWRGRSQHRFWRPIGLGTTEMI